MKRIPLSTPTMHDTEIEYVRQAFESNWIAPLGPHCDAFEKEVQSLLGQGIHALAVSSGTAALHLALKLAGIGPGDVVFCSDLTFCASVNPVCYEGGIPVFVDSEEDTWNMDPQALELAFEKYPHARAVVLVHLFGTPAKSEKIRQICDAHGAVLIEDAAEAMGASCHGRPCGTFGDFGVFSFNGNKMITTSGGGMLLTHSRQMRERALYLATQAKLPYPWYEHSEIGCNYRLSNILAAIGRAQLPYLSEHCTRKAQIYARYADGLRESALTMNPYDPDTSPNFWLSCILLSPSARVTPLQLQQVLDAHNMEARPVWKPMHLQPVFAGADFISLTGAPVSEALFRRGLCLPSDIKMTPEEQDRVIRVLRKMLEE